ncbi:MAG: hypothetical protein AVDCRST_MAG77-1631 [uncultured Chloroflexi bacterium]|uniref:histidine kinase n=1 Tax=uncultured Chloroflexota bacterium TaxID=166587 RepID=A0A6J4I4J0_9CHLR|nr:MAG: hypothetical protein AVDCRST_MAG77-1631 [uncultured Chloroflexota bacterium]
MLLRLYRRAVPVPDDVVAERRALLRHIEGMVWLIVVGVVILTTAGNVLLHLAKGFPTAHSLAAHAMWSVLIAGAPSIPATIIILRHAFRLSAQFGRQQVELLEVQRRAMRLDGAMSVARTAAHRVNNALAPVVGYAELLSISPTARDDPRLADFAARIIEGAEQATAEVRRLQQIVRLEEEPNSPVPVLNMDASTAPE